MESSFPPARLRWRQFRSKAKMRDVNLVLAGYGRTGVNGLIKCFSRKLTTHVEKKRLCLMNPWERDIWKYFMEIASTDQPRRQPRSQGLSSPSGGLGGGRKRDPRNEVPTTLPQCHPPFLLIMFKAPWKWRHKVVWSRQDCAQLADFERPIYTAESFWYGSDKTGSRTKKDGSAQVNFVV